MTSDLCIFTANADALLYASAARVNISICSYHCNPWPGYVTGKLKRGIEFLNTRTEQYAMWIDGMDTLLLKSEVAIIDELWRCRTPVMAAENNCWPDSYAARFYPSPSGPYINAGCFAGRRTRLLEAMHTALQCAIPGDEDDQRAWTTAYIRHYNSDYPELAIDSDRRIFQCMGDGGDVRDTCVAHWNGRTPGREEYWKGLQAAA